MNTQNGSNTKLLSMAKVQESLDVSRMTLVRIINNRIIKTVRIGRSVKIPESALIEFIEKGGDRNISSH